MHDRTHTRVSHTATTKRRRNFARVAATLLASTIVFSGVASAEPAPASASPPTTESTTGRPGPGPPNAGASTSDAPISTSPGSTPKPAAWHLVAGVGTDFPVTVGARAHVEAPFRLRLSTSIGILPGPYVDAINGIVVAMGGYSDATADLVRAALKSSLVWRTHVGFRPFERLGLYVEGGYGLVTLGGDATASQIVAGVTGKQPPATEQSGDKTYDAKATLHMVDAEVGWDFAVWERLSVRLAIGGAFTVASSTTIEPTYSPRAPRLVQEFTAEGEKYLDDTFTSYVFTPVVGLGVGYLFF